MEKFNSEYRVVAYFKDVYPSPTQYRRKTYKTFEEAQEAFNEALKFYHRPQYLKHLESVAIEDRQVSEWRWIGSEDEV